MPGIKNRAINGKRSMVCAFLFLAAGVFFPGSVKAQAVPPHLASFSSSLYRQLEQKLSSPEGSAEEKQAMESARAALRRAGIANWSPQPVMQQGVLQALAAPLGLDPAKEGDRKMIDALLREDDMEGRREQIGKILKKTGRDGDEAALSEAVGAFDAARAESIKDMPRMHRMKLGETGTLETLWRPEENRVEMVVSGRVGDRPGGEEYKTVLSGDAAPKPSNESGDVPLEVKADEDGAQAYAGESLEKLRASIFGEWKGPRGEKWVVAKADGSVPEPQTETVPDRQAEIRNKRKEIEDLKKQKVFVWKNSKNGKITRQTRFKRLEEPFVYEGESYGDEAGAARLKALEAELAALESAAAKKLPVDEHDPVGMKIIADEAQPLRITVTQADGYSYTYRNAYFDGHRITADRTLTDRRDITDLPDDVTGQLISGWSPPEWIELQVRPEGESVRLDGTWWRLHVTYSGGFFGMGGNTVESIHTPYSVSLDLRKEGDAPAKSKTAEGAGDSELL